MSSQAAEFVSVFMSERGRLFRLISRIVRDPSIADDLVQETFLRVNGVLGRAQIADHRGYLVRTATNVALDYRRQLARLDRIADADHEFAGLGQADATPENDLAARQAFRTVNEALGRLPPRTRRAFEMHRFEERTMPEIARVLGVSTGLIHKLVMDGYWAVRNELHAGGFISGAENPRV